MVGLLLPCLCGGAQCVVGEKIWMIESEFPTYKVTRWFTGTNIIEHTLITKDAPEPQLGCCW